MRQLHKVVIENNNISQKNKTMPEIKKLKVNANALRVRKKPSLSGAIIGQLLKAQLVDYVEISEDQKWIKIQDGDLVGWSYFQYLEPIIENSISPINSICNIAATSAIATYNWTKRGVAYIGYIKGMAVIFARAYCKWKANDKYILEMAKATSADKATDVLAFYGAKFDELNLSNEADGVNTLRHLFVLLLGLGMMESNGRYCEGRDRAATNTTSETAEAGMFQTSYNARSAHPYLTEMFQEYLASTENSFIEIFKEGVTVKEKDLENFGSGNGLKFQKLSKSNPAFATEFAALTLRFNRSHWGPINNRKVELKLEAEKMFLQVQSFIDINNLTKI
jgi:hypothetical protein